MLKKDLESVKNFQIPGGVHAYHVTIWAISVIRYFAAVVQTDLSSVGEVDLEKLSTKERDCIRKELTCLISYIHKGSFMPLSGL